MACQRAMGRISATKTDCTPVKCYSLHDICNKTLQNRHRASMGRDRGIQFRRVRPSKMKPVTQIGSQKQMTDTTEPNALMKRLPIIVIGVVAVLGAYFLRDYLTFDALAENRESLIEFRDANYLLTVLVFIAIYTVVVAFSLPGATILTLAGGFLFATFPGFLFNVAAATLGATGIFLAARWGFGKQLGAKLEGSEGIVKKIKDGIDENQWSMLFLIRLVPAVPFFLANLIPAFLEVPLRRFVISTFFGIIPGSIVYTSVGAGLGEVFAAGETPNLGIIFEPHILLPILGLCVLAVLPIIIKAVRGKKGL